jgi:hypothetical protein
LICIAYLSSARTAPERDTLQTILAVSRRNNAACGVTGMLCYYDGSFLQFLEGEAADVDATFERIQRDGRHQGLIEVFRDEITQRLFPDWTMALARLDDVSPEQRAFCRGLRSVELAATPAHRKAIEPFLQTFRAWMR